MELKSSKRRADYAKIVALDTLKYMCLLHIDIGLI